MAGPGDGTIYLSGMANKPVSRPARRRRERPPAAAATADLALLLERWLEVGGPYRTISELARRSGVGERKIHGILHGEYQTVLYRCADSLLVAIDRADAMHSGEVRLVRAGSLGKLRQARAA
jgi:hypothetical protein